MMTGIPGSDITRDGQESWEDLTQNLTDWTHPRRNCRVEGKHGPIVKFDNALMLLLMLWNGGPWTMGYHFAALHGSATPSNREISAPVVGAVQGCSLRIRLERARRSSLERRPHSWFGCRTLYHALHSPRRYWQDKRQIEGKSLSLRRATSRPNSLVSMLFAFRRSIPITHQVKLGYL